MKGRQIQILKKMMETAMLSQFFYHSDKLVSIYCHQVAAWVPDMFCNIYLVKNHKIANNSTNTEASTINNSTYLE